MALTPASLVPTPNRSGAYGAGDRPVAIAGRQRLRAAALLMLLHREKSGGSA